jgi:hypothetical protein
MMLKSMPKKRHDCKICSFAQDDKEGDTGPKFGPMHIDQKDLSQKAEQLSIKHYS